MPPDPHEPPEQPLSLEKLSRTFARLFSRRKDVLPETQTQAEVALHEHPQEDTAASIESEDGIEPASLVDDDAGEVTPRSILEAMLFVGAPDNAPLTAEQAASAMRGVEPAEVHDLVQELNRQYAADGCPYIIASHDAGYRLVLREQFHRLRDRLLGRQRQARLSQAAIDVLAIVAYNEPLSGDEVARLRGASSGAVLSQLVRRQLLRLHRPESEPRKPLYYTTGRFLELFGLESLGDLPQSQELDR